MRANNIKLAVLFSLLAAFFYAVLGTLIKISEQTIPKEMIVFGRQCVGFFTILPFMLFEKNKTTICKPESFRLHLLRAVASIGSMYCLVYALQHLPLVDALLLTYTRPLFIPIVVFIWFRKKWSKNTWFGLIVGFLGVALILKPDKRVFDIAAVIGLGSAMFGAIAFTCIRRLTKTNSANSILFYYLILSIPIAAIPLFKSWTTLDLKSWGFLIAIGIFGTVYQMTMTRAYQYAKSFKVASMLYSTIVFGAIFDWWLGDFSLDYFGAIGMVLIIIGTILTVRQKSAPFPPETPIKKG